uniref:Uncharacterized protein n=1 Tax=Caenorhabditis japonica TaxID=281687 RepID=A0A8R1EST4_CAEJA
MERIYSAHSPINKQKPKMSSKFSYHTAIESDFDRIMKFLSEYFFKEEPFTR